MNTTLITSYVNPDLDGIACCFAYAERFLINIFDYGIRVI